MRFFKRGPIEVVRHLLDVRDRLPTDADDQVGVSAEIRALRPWEQFDEGILRWGTRITIGPPGAGLFNGAQLYLNGWHQTAGTFGPVPRGTLWILDYLRVFTTNIQVRRTAASTGLISGGDLNEYTDTRWGGINPVAPLNFVTGSNAAIYGEEIFHLDAGQVSEERAIFISEATPLDQLGNDHALTLWAQTANATLDVIVGGLVIFPR